MIIIENAQVLDAALPEPRPGHHVLIEGDRIREVADRPISAADAARIDAAGRTLMPGLIDAHVHVTAVDLDTAALRATPLTLMTAQAARVMTAMLDRGFTTVRDAHGADWGLRQAVERGLISGPRLFISGQAISTTGGHGDRRVRTDGAPPCACANAASRLHRLADGVAEVRKAARDELRQGADQIKVLLSGGVANDPVENCYFSEEELRAMVDEAKAWNSYVVAHSYTARSTMHALRAGVRSIEHGNLIDAATADMMAARDAFLVPTLVAYEAVHRRGGDLGLPDASMRKLRTITDAGLTSVELCRAAGVRMGFGTDLQGVLHDDQSLEFSLRGQVQSAHEVIASATAVNASLLNREGELGALAPGALADILLVDGNPLDDLGLLQGQGEHLSLIMQGGRIHKNRLS